jgi:protease-4
MGVVGGKLALGHALAQIGVHSEVFPANPQPTAGARAGYPSMFAEWDDATRARVLESMTAVYDLFLSRVAEGRGTSVDAIQPFAEGRLFSGTQAREHGLIDAIGGLSAAVAKARELAKLPADAELEPVGTPSGLLRALGGAVHGPLSAASSPDEAFTRALEALTPEVAHVVSGLLPLASGERTLTLLPFAVVVR